eukprot:GFUD01002453.1.p1 GENE.GFUD01002453.1~~GFUD01002453.1.p1  ORF type:complete len:235 (+),score=54.74 GFUD01002453.1:42-746(+)
MEPLQEQEGETIGDNELAVERKRKLSCFERIFSIVFKKKPMMDINKNEKLLELLKPIRYKPDTVEQMALETKFTKEEVKSLYRAFKQECPTGISDEDTFKDVYQKIFPLGESSKYAHLVFNSIDREQTGGITFGDFMDFLSVLTKGSEEEKILWSFEFYDVNRDGIISRDEMIKVTDSIYDLVGAETHPKIKMQNVEQVFSCMDSNRDGIITKEEFVRYCSDTHNVSRNLAVLP